MKEKCLINRIDKQSLAGTQYTSLQHWQQNHDGKESKLINCLSEHGGKVRCLRFRHFAAPERSTIWWWQCG